VSAKYYTEIKRRASKKKANKQDGDWILLVAARFHDENSQDAPTDCRKQSSINAHVSNSRHVGQETRNNISQSFSLRFSVDAYNPHFISTLAPTQCPKEEYWKIVAWCLCEM